MGLDMDFLFQFSFSPSLPHLRQMNGFGIFKWRDAFCVSSVAQLHNDWLIFQAVTASHICIFCMHVHG